MKRKPALSFPSSLSHWECKYSDNEATWTMQIGQYAEDGTDESEDAWVPSSPGLLHMPWPNYTWTGTQK